ncbi:heme ABC transporter ATP-binding protein [Sandaracinobacteroides hominis]|uniref:heme ABC transporter ATP-binding protein n=1 Tax=Sandaracinobacteroides hominis TaxID=2780086 RepID=UPI0018F563FA|nr:heme ABC transporter ATP-binding protein [Sandaracinobacteroides hominis]
MKLETSALTLARGPRTILSGLSLRFQPGTVTVLAGPNGAGKSTLIDCLAGDLAPTSGQVQLNGQPLESLPLQARARQRAVLPQRAMIAFDFPVAEVVAMGLHPHGIGARSAEGRALVSRAMADMDLAEFADRPATRLSGGEQQRVHIARCLTQARAAGGPALLLLDEPTGGLDYRHQFALAQLLRAAAAEGATILVSLHDLPLASRLADRLLLLGDGRLVAEGPPAILTPALVARLYGIDEAAAAELLPSPPSLPLRLAAE